MTPDNGKRRGFFIWNKILFGWCDRATWKVHYITIMLQGNVFNDCVSSRRHHRKIHVSENGGFAGLLIRGLKSGPEITDTHLGNKIQGTESEKREIKRSLSELITWVKLLKLFSRKCIIITSDVEEANREGGNFWFCYFKGWKPVKNSLAQFINGLNLRQSVYTTLG